MTKLRTTGRQLSVLLGLALSLPAPAQMSAGVRDAIETIPAATAPAYDPKKTMLRLKQVTVNDTGMDDLKFRRFYVKPDLSFGVQYNYDMHFNFMATDARGLQRPIPDGYYQLTIATFKKDASDVTNRPDRVKPGETLTDRFITRTPPMYVLVTGGEADVEVPLRFDQPGLAAIDNTLYIEFIPLESECGRGRKKQPCLTIKADGEPDQTRSEIKARADVFPYLMNMNFLPYTKSNAGRKNPRVSKFTAEIMDVGLATFTARAMAQKMREELNLQGQRRPLTPEQYAKRNELTMMSLDDADLARSGSRWLRGGSVSELIKFALHLPGTGPLRSNQVAQQLQNVFCQYLTDQAMPHANVGAPDRLTQSLRQQLAVRNSLCQQGGEISVKFRRVQHVGRVTRQLLNREGSSILRYVIMNNFNVTRSSERSSSKAWSFKPFQAVFKALDPLGLLPFDYTQTISVGSTRSRSQNASTSTQEYLDLNTVTLEIPTANSRACLEVSLRNERHSPLMDARKGEHQGLYLCDAVQPTLNVHESYQHAFTHMSDSTLGDPHDRLTQTFNRTLRGDTNLAALYYATRKGLNAEQMGERPPSWYTAEAAAYFAEAPAPEPGLIISPITFDRSEVPSFVEAFIFNPGGQPVASVPPGS